MSKFLHNMNEQSKYKNTTLTRDLAVQKQKLIMKVETHPSMNSLLHK